MTLVGPLPEPSDYKLNFDELNYSTFSVRLYYVHNTCRTVVILITYVESLPHNVTFKLRTSKKLASSLKMAKS
jgi:hypothetical protein